MPRNYYRLCDAIAQFHARYDHWPTLVRLPEGSLEALRGDVGEEGFARLASLLDFEVDEAVFAAEDETGASFDYMHSRFMDGQRPTPDIGIESVVVWLRVEPTG